MGALALFVVGVAIFTSAFSCLAQRFWPDAPQLRLTTVCGLLIPLALLALFPITMVWSWLFSKPSSVPADGLAIIAIGMMCAFSALLSFFIAWPTAHLTLQYLRRK